MFVFHATVEADGFEDDEVEFADHPIGVDAAAAVVSARMCGVGVLFADGGPEPDGLAFGVVEYRVTIRRAEVAVRHSVEEDLALAVERNLDSGPTRRARVARAGHPAAIDCFV